MDMLGKTLGNYRIDRLLGEGRMGPVYQAYHLSLQQDVAIKLIHTSFTLLPGFRERFTEEARILSEMDHPGIVRVLDFGQHRDQMYMVMEYIPGLNLRQLLDELIKARRWLPLPEALLLIEQLCDAIEYAEQHKLLHREVKPANLMLKPEPAENIPFQIVLTDLGLTQLLQAADTTHDQNDPHSPPYMSPEQALGQATDSRSTVYSLGILLYELVVGILPFPVQSLTDAVIFHTKEPPPAPRSIRPELSPALEQIILKALEKEPGKRYQTAAEMGNALKGVSFDSTAIEEPADKQDSSLTTQYVSGMSVAGNAGSRSVIKRPELGQTEAQPAFVPSPAPVPSKFSIEVLSKGKEIQRFPLSSATVFIGRDKENHIVLDNPDVSRRHTQITSDGSNYYVTDLKSRNGTFLENQRLATDTPYLWKPHQELRIGGFVLRLSGQVPPQTLFKSVGTELIHTSVTPQQLAMEAGGSATANLFLLNQGANADQFSLSVIGIPEDWVANLPNQVMLMPGVPKEITISVHVPRLSQVKAGRHSLTFQVSRQNDTSRFWEAKLTLTVAAYSQFEVDLQPPRLRAGQIGQLIITNQGNIQELFEIQFIDNSGELVFEPPQLQARVPPGGTVAAQYRANVKPTLSSIVGGERALAYSARVSLPNGENQTLQTDLISTALFPVWVLPAVLLLCLFFVGSVAGLWWYLGQRQATLEIITQGNGTVTVSPNGENCSSTCLINVEDNSTVTLIAAPTSPSTFGGWSGACTGIEPTCSIKVSDRQTITATFNPPGSKTLSVTLNGNGAVTSNPAGIVCGSTCSYAFPDNTSVTLTADPAEPSTFGGWSGACTGAGLTCTVSMSAAQAVTATFNAPGKQTLRVSVNGNGTVTSAPSGISCPSTCSFEFADNSTVTLIADPTEPSSFGSWSGACGGAALTCEVKMSDVQNVTAIFNSPGGQRLTLNKAGTGDGTVTVSPGGTICNLPCSPDFPFDTPVTLTANASPSSTFVGWSGACTNTTGPCNVRMNGAQTVTAIFDLRGNQSLIVRVNGSGKVFIEPNQVTCDATCPIEIPFGADVTLTANPDNPSLPITWSGAGCSTNPCRFKMTSAQDVTVTFSPPGKKTLTVTLKGNGIVTSSPAGLSCNLSVCSGSFDFNTEVKLTADPADNVNFKSWSGVSSCSVQPVQPECTVTITQDLPITATFNTPPSIDGGETVTIPPVDENIPTTTPVTTVKAQDPDNNETLTYVLISATDWDDFRIDQQTGAITFLQPPDHETPKDANIDNTYEIRVRVTDSLGDSDEQTIKIEIKDIPDPD